MAKSTNADHGCEEELAQCVSKSFAMLKQCFEDNKLKDFEGRAGSLAQLFEPLRPGAMNARDYDGAASATSRLEKELDGFEAAFEKWYDAEADDISFFAHVASLFLDVRLKLEIYRGGAGALGEAGGNTGKAKAICERWKEEFKAAVQKYDSLAQQVAAKAGNSLEKERAERITDLTSTMLRYIDLNHESAMLEVDEHTAGRENPLGKALRLAGGAQGQCSDMRAHAYHLHNEAMQEEAADASFAFFAYVGAVCAAFAVQEAAQG